MPDDTAQRFEARMYDLYHRAKRECGINAVAFLKMLNEHGGLETARLLLHSPTISEGFTKLWEAKRLDLTVEVLILKPEWDQLFTAEEKSIARNRLLQYGYIHNQR